MVLNRLHCKLSASIFLLILSLAHPGAAQEPPMEQLTHSPKSNEGSPAWSPDGSQIAFVSSVSGNDGNIWVMPASGEPEIQLTFSPASDRDPAWSPVGPQIAIAYNRDHGDWDIYVLIGGDADLLSYNGAADIEPTWAPDGTQIAFASERQFMPFRIVVMPAAGEPPYTVLTKPGFISREPAWSPDGTQIAFMSNRAGTFDLWVMPASGELEGELATRLTDYPGHEHDPSWSPDGAWIAFSRDIGGNDDIWVISAAGGQPIQLTTHPADDGSPAWSPDGMQIAFASTRNTQPARSDIWVMELPTLGLESAPVSLGAVRLVVSPNPFRETATIHLGAAESGSSLRILNVAGRLVREIATPAGALSGTRTIVWDGRDAQGQPVAGGVYYLHLEGVNGAAGRAIRVR